MANYKTSNITGEQRTRAYEITISNRLNSIPTAIFGEEQALELPTGTISLGNQTGCSVAFDSVNGQIALRNPMTNDLTGEVVPHALLQQLLYSLYIQTALERDAATLAAQPI